MPRRVYGKISDLLQKAVDSRKHPMHNMVFAATDRNCMPISKIVVIRQFSQVHKYLHFYFDVRSFEMKDFIQKPVAQVLAYSPQDKVQLRFNCKLKLHYQNEITDSAWNNMRVLGRRCFTMPFAPSTPLRHSVRSAKIPQTVHPIDKTDSDAGYTNFAVVECHFDYIDYLELNTGRHLSYRLHFEEDALRLSILTP